MFGMTATQQGSAPGDPQRQNIFATPQQQQQQQQTGQQSFFGAAASSTQCQFGQGAAQQQSSFSFPQQQVQQSFGSTSGGSNDVTTDKGFQFGQLDQQQHHQHQQQQQQLQQQLNNPLFTSNQPRHWILEGTPGSRLRWVKVENESIPDDAVEGGWCSSSNQPYYVARSTYEKTKNVTYGYVRADKTSGKITCHFVPHPVNRSNSSGGFFGAGAAKPTLYSTSVAPSSFEVLVNPSQAPMELSWVPITNTLLHPGRKPIIPSNPIAFEDNRCSKIFIGRTIAGKGSDSVPGYCTNQNGLTVFIGIKENGDSVYKKENPTTFEVLCSVGDTGGDRVEQCYLYDVKYSKTDMSCETDYVTLASTLLRNNCTEKQKMMWNPSPSLCFEDELSWDIGTPMKCKCEVKAAVPYCLVNEDEDESIHFTDVGVLPPGLIHRPWNGGFGGGFGSGFGGPNQPINALIQSRDDDEPGSLLDQTTGYISLGKVAKRNQSIVQQTNFMGDKFKVPARSCLGVGFRGCKKTVKVSFTGKMKTVHGNDSVKDEAVNGVFTGAQITSVARAVMEQHLLKQK